MRVLSAVFAHALGIGADIADAVTRLEGRIEQLDEPELFIVQLCGAVERAAAHIFVAYLCKLRPRLTDEIESAIALARPQPYAVVGECPRELFAVESLCRRRSERFRLFEMALPLFVAHRRRKIAQYAHSEHRQPYAFAPIARADRIERVVPVSAPYFKQSVLPLPRKRVRDRPFAMLLHRTLFARLRRFVPRLGDPYERRRTQIGNALFEQRRVSRHRHPPRGEQRQKQLVVRYPRPHPCSRRMPPMHHVPFEILMRAHVEKDALRPLGIGRNYRERVLQDVARAYRAARLIVTASAEQPRRIQLRAQPAVEEIVKKPLSAVDRHCVERAEKLLRPTTAARHVAERQRPQRLFVRAHYDRKHALALSFGLYLERRGRIGRLCAETQPMRQPRRPGVGRALELCADAREIHLFACRAIECLYDAVPRRACAKRPSVMRSERRQHPPIRVLGALIRRDRAHQCRGHFAIGEHACLDIPIDVVHARAKHRRTGRMLDISALTKPVYPHRTAARERKQLFARRIERGVVEPCVQLAEIGASRPAKAAARLGDDRSAARQIYHI